MILRILAIGICIRAVYEEMVNGCLMGGPRTLRRSACVWKTENFSCDIVKERLRTTMGWNSAFMTKRMVRADPILPDTMTNGIKAIADKSG